MAAMNSSVLACSYAVSGMGSSELTSKYAVTMASPSLQKLPFIIKSQQQSSSNMDKDQIAAGRRVALLGLAAALFTTASSANAGVIDEYLEKSLANKVRICMLIYYREISQKTQTFNVIQSIYRN